MAFGLSSVTSFLKKGITSSSHEDGFVGVDIGASAIKIVQVKDVHGVPTLETYGELQLGPYEGGDIGKTTHLPQAKQVQALIDILREAGATGNQAAFAFSYNSSFTQVITVPALDEEQVAAMIPIEARKYVPFSLSRVALDWVALEVREEKQETVVLLSAIYNEAIERYESIMRGAQLESTMSEIELFSSIRSAILPTDRVSAVLDMGASLTRLYIVKDGFVRKTHSVPMAGEGATVALQNALKTSFVNAEEIKRTYGLLGKQDEPLVKKTLGTAIERGLREIHTVISRYEEAEGVTVERVMLSGGGSLLKGIDAYVAEMFARPIALVNPFGKVAYPAFLEDTLKEAGPSFAVAIGVALRAFQNTK